MLLRCEVVSEGSPNSTSLQPVPHGGLFRATRELWMVLNWPGEPATVSISAKANHLAPTPKTPLKNYRPL